MDSVPEIERRPTALALILVFFAGLALNLVAYGAHVIPKTGRLSIGCAVVVLVGYAVFAFVVVPPIQRREPEVISIATRAGLYAAAVFAAGVCLEFTILPRNNVALVSVEFGFAFLICAWAAGRLAVRDHTLRDVTVGSVLAAMMALAVWSFFALGALLLKVGPARQQIFRMGDVFGATSFNLLMGPVAIAICAVPVFALVKLVANA